MIYFDHHATTPMAPQVLDAMLPFFQSHFANAGSTTHLAGREVAEAVQQGLRSIAAHIGCAASEIVVTSGATESNNLALFGTLLHPRQTRRKIISLATEHRAILDPLKRLERHGFEVQFAPVVSHGDEAGRIDLDSLSSMVDDKTALLTIMLANNEIGVLQPISTIAELCRPLGILLHTDASQAVGHQPIDLQNLDVDLLSFSAHKFYGPKGVGGLYVRQRPRSVRLDPQILGGGHQLNRRSGTLNVPGIIGMAKALELVQPEDSLALSQLRDSLWQKLQQSLGERVILNGPAFGADIRLGHNLNCQFQGVEGQSLMLAIPELAVSSGSACTSAEPAPSHVLQGIGLDIDQARSSLRFGLGRYNTLTEVEQASLWLRDAYLRLVG
jgi:cysteine desulfurase